jgi:leucyl-tRNA synthetase
MHLLYSRFWHAFLYDQKVVPTPEPYAWRLNGGILLGSDGQKQSKSRGNVVDPLAMIANYGADALRLYICFMGPYDSTMPWNENGLKACRKVVDTLFTLSERVDLSGSFAQELELKKALHRLIKRSGEMFDAFKMNTVVSEYMIFLNELKKAPKVELDLWKDFLKVLAPMAAFTAEELWQRCHGRTTDGWKPEYSVHLQSWPEFDPALTAIEKVVVGIQVNGKLRGEIEVNVDEDQESVQRRVLEMPAIQKWMEGKPLKKFIYQKGRIVSVVV